MRDRLEWEITVPLLSNSYILSDVIVVMFINAIIVAGFLLVVRGLEQFEVLKFFLLVSGVLVVLLIGVMGLVFLNMFEMKYRIDDEGVFSGVGEFTSNMNRIAWTISEKSQNLSLTGSSILANGQKSVQIPWSSIKKVAIDEEKRVITLSAVRRPLVRLFCLPENMYDAVALVENHLPDAFYWKS